MFPNPEDQMKSVVENIVCQDHPHLAGALPNVDWATLIQLVLQIITLVVKAGPLPIPPAPPPK